MSVATSSPATTQDRPRIRARALASATGAAVVAWLAIDVGVGYEIQAPGFGTVPPTHIGPGAVAVAALAATSLGWALAAILERWAAASARLAWTSTAVAFTLLSAGGPLSGTGITTGQRVVLLLLHLVVAAVFIPSMWRSFESAGRGE